MKGCRVGGIISRDGQNDSLDGNVGWFIGRRRKLAELRFFCKKTELFHGNQITCKIFNRSGICVFDRMTVIIETPKGSAYKYKYEPGKKAFEVHKTMPAGMVFPFDFGFVPDTLGEDGDPLDVLILTRKAPYATGSTIDARIIGCLPAKQSSKEGELRNDRYVGVVDDDADYATVKSIEQLPEAFIRDIQSFFINYLSVEGKQVTFLTALNAQQAQQLLQIAMA